MIPELYIWGAAALMLKRYGDKALEQSSARANELTGDGDHGAADTWHRITTVVAQLTNTTARAAALTGPDQKRSDRPDGTSTVGG